jgi:hypothetical protein
MISAMACVRFVPSPGSAFAAAAFARTTTTKVIKTT